MTDLKAKAQIHTTKVHIFSTRQNLKPYGNKGPASVCPPHTRTPKHLVTHTQINFIKAFMKTDLDIVTNHRSYRDRCPTQYLLNKWQKIKQNELPATSSFLQGLFKGYTGVRSVSISRLMEWNQHTDTVATRAARYIVSAPTLRCAQDVQCDCWAVFSTHACNDQLGGNVSQLFA